MLDYVKKANQLVLTRDRYQQEREDLALELIHKAAGAALFVQGEAYDRSVIHIGSQEWTLDQIYRGVRIYLDSEADRIVAGEL